MQREYTRLRPKAKQQADRTGNNTAISAVPLHLACFHRCRKPGKLQRSQLPIQEEQPHQHNQPADNRNCQIGLRSPERFLRFLVGYPCIRSKGHDLKEYKYGKEVRRKKYTDSGSQR